MPHTECFTDQTLPPACLRLADQIVLPVGTRVFQAGDECRQFVFLLEGSIRVDIVTRTGKTIMLYRFGPGQTCILTTSCLMSDEPYSAEAHVEKAATVCVLPLQAFEALLSSSADFRSLVFASFSYRLSDMMAKIEEIAFTPIDRRLAKRVLQLVDSTSRIGATHEHLAADIGTAREVVSRKLAHWEGEGLIVRGRGGFEILNLHEIEQLAGDGD